MFSCVKVFCITTITKNITKITWLVICCFFSIQTVAGSGYYGIECLYFTYVIKKLDFFLAVWVLEVKTISIVLGSLAICAKVHH